MPELPEVETTRRGIIDHIKDRKIEQVVVRQRALRWPVPEDLSATLSGQPVIDVQRRAKYLLLRTPPGTLLIHLGMSGSLRILNREVPPAKHDHIDLVFTGNTCLRYTDPRRFGSFLWQEGDPNSHPLLSSLGPEPLTESFDGDHLFQASRNRHAPIKSFIMDNRVVVGVGNIYANEALFLSGIHPKRAAGRIGRSRYDRLATNIKHILSRAIEVGGTTLRDFTNSSGNPGYFKQSLQVYGRGKEACKTCSASLKEIRLGQRSTVYCPRCQT